MSFRARRPVLAVVTTSAALVAAGLVATPAAATSTDPHWFAAQVKTKEVLQHLEALQEIADAHDGTRASGTPGFDASGDYVQGLLEDAGYTVGRQPFDFVYTETLAQTLVVGGTTVPGDAFVATHLRDFELRSSFLPLMVTAVVFAGVVLKCSRSVGVFGSKAGVAGKAGAFFSGIRSSWWNVACDSVTAIFASLMNISTKRGF